MWFSLKKESCYVQIENCSSRTAKLGFAHDDDSCVIARNSLIIKTYICYTFFNLLFSLFLILIYVMHINAFSPRFSSPNLSYPQQRTISWKQLCNQYRDCLSLKKKKRSSRRETKCHQNKKCERAFSIRANIALCDAHSRRIFHPWSVTCETPSIKKKKNMYAFSSSCNSHGADFFQKFHFASIETCLMERHTFVISRAGFFSFARKKSKTDLFHIPITPLSRDHFHRETH